MTVQLTTNGSRGVGVRRRSLLRRFAAGVAGAALAASGAGMTQSYHRQVMAAPGAVWGAPHVLESVPLAMP